MKHFSLADTQATEKRFIASPSQSTVKRFSLADTQATAKRFIASPSQSTVKRFKTVAPQATQARAKKVYTSRENSEY